MNFVQMLVGKIGDAVDEYGYETLTCREAVIGTGSKSLVIRVDVDFVPYMALRAARMFDRRGMKATFFWRAHSSTYDLEEVVPTIRIMKRLGFEIGLHHEAITQGFLGKRNPMEIMAEDLRLLRDIAKAEIHGVSSHGTFFREWNNLDFWKEYRPTQFGVYEAYDLMEKMWYVSDSCGPRWKVYDCGVLRPEDCRAPWELMRDGVGPLYLLIHPCVYD